MSVHLTFSVRGWSPRRQAYMLMLTCLGFVPVHFTETSCEESEGLFAYACVNFLLAGVLCLFIPRKEDHRFTPLAFALFVLVAHMFCVH